MTFFFQKKTKSFFDQEFASLVPSELNFWVFLLIICQFSNFSEQIILGSCVFALLIIILNFFLVFFRSLPETFKAWSIFLCLLLLMISLPQVIIFYLPVILLRSALSSFLAALFLVICCLIWALPSSEEIKYRAIIMKFLPGFLFSLFLLSLSYWFFVINLIFFYFIFLVYNFSFIKKVFKEDWSPMILRSSLIFNFFRFFLPFPLFSEVFLFSEFVICGPGLVGILKVASPVPKLSGYERFLMIQPKPRFFFSGSALISKKFASFYNSEDFIHKFIKEKLPILIEEFAKQKAEGFPTETLKNIIKEFPVKNADRFIKASIALDSREPLHQIMLIKLLAPLSVIPATSLFNGLENLPTVHPEDLLEFSKVKDVLHFYFEDKQVESPFIFYLEDEWHLAINSKESRRITKEAVLYILNDLTEKQEFWKHSCKGFSGLSRGLAFFPLNDFLVFDPVNSTKFLFNIQAKSSFYYLRDTKTDFFSMLDIENQRFSIYNYNNERLELTSLFSEELSVIKKEAATGAFQAKVSKAIFQVELMLANEALLNEMRLSIVNEIVPRGPLLLKKDSLPLSLVNKKEDF